MGPAGGVFVGVSQLEYARICLEAEPGLNAYYATGSHLSVTSGRLSYTFGLRGPAMSGDHAPQRLSHSALTRLSWLLAASAQMCDALFIGWLHAGSILQKHMHCAGLLAGRALQSL